MIIIKKRPSTLFNMLTTLSLVCAISGMSIAYVNELTKGPKALQRLERKLKAIEYVSPTFNNNPQAQSIFLPIDGNKDSLEIFPLALDDKYIGTCIASNSKKGFSGLIEIMVGFDLKGNIYGIKVLQHKETPGLGTKMKDEKFKTQFYGKNPNKYELKIIKDGGDVDAITAATITSRAFCDAVERAYNLYIEHKEVIQISTNNKHGK